MRRPLPITVCWGLAAVNAWARGSSAVSSEAEAVQKAACAIVDSAEKSESLFGKKATAISQLVAMTVECSEAGWDGCEANPVDLAAMNLAASFVRALPDGIPLPEFAGEPDGSISLDWIQSRHRLFTLSVGRTNRLAYAWIDGADRGHAVAQFDGENIPPLILEGVKAIMSHGATPIRAV